MSSFGTKNVHSAIVLGSFLKILCDKWYANTGSVTLVIYYEISTMTMGIIFTEKWLHHPTH